MNLKSRLAVTVVFAAIGTTFAASERPEIPPGIDSWSCRPRHPAVVNSVVGRSEDVISLRGEWDFLLTDRFAKGRRNSHDVAFFLDTDEWKRHATIRVPGCWEAQLPPNPGMGQSWEFKYDHAPKPLRNPALGEGWYRRDVDIPKNWAGKRVWLKVGGVKSCAWIWVNRRQVALVWNYCGTYKYDVTDCVKPGERAEVVVEVSNLVPSRKGCMSEVHRWGGIYRDIELEATPPDAWVDDAWVRGDFDRHLAEVHVDVEEGEKVEGVRDLVLRATVEGETAQAPVKHSGNSNNQTILKIPLRSFRPWSPERPNLYTARVELVGADGKVLQTRLERFGVRKLEVRGTEFHLNGHPFFARGFGDDCVYPDTGLTPADRAVHLAHLKTARAAGFNFVRLHTHCEIPEYFEAADEAGVLVEAELPYINGDIPEEHFSFDPVADTLELYGNYRRHPSFAVYSGGNEGTFGPKLDRELYRLVKRIDPDRLKICQDTQMQRFNTAENSDYTGGPVAEWPRGAVNPDRPFLCHEYLNLCIKLDARNERDYTGAWLPPTTRERRNRWLAGFGLDSDWGDRLQDSQHALQAYWLKHGVECARNDPYCDGFCLWTIVDVVVAQFDSYTSQGLFDPFWRPKRRGWKPSDFAAFNSPCCVLVDMTPAKHVFMSGERLSCAFRLSDYDADAAGHPATLDWRVTVGGERLAGGRQGIARRQPGPVRAVASVDLTVPDVRSPTKAELSARVGRSENSWELWIFPERKKIRLDGVAATAALLPKLGALYDGVVSASSLDGVRALAAERGDPLVAEALAKGLNVVQVGPVNRSPPRECRAWVLGVDVDPKSVRRQDFGTDDICLGWWFMGHQVGTAIRDHAALGALPHEGVLSPLLFRIIGQGRKLPQPGVDSKSLVIGGEGGDACYAYLNARDRLVEIDGLDLLSGFPEGTAILDGIFGSILSGK